MQITISAIGKIGNNPIKLSINEYCRRTPWIRHIDEFQSKANNLKTIKEDESKLLLSSYIPGYLIIILDEKGVQKTSLGFYDLIQNYRNSNINKLAFFIGGAQGHGDLIKSKADFKLSLSQMTLPHMLARLILIEQIYRIYSMSINHPYHKD